MTNHYKTLGVSNFASTNEIKTAYRKLSKKFHPDVNQGDKFFEERFKEIQNAYEALNDSNERKILDDFLKQSETKSQYQNYQSKEGTKSNESKKNEQTKDETHKTYSNTKTTNARDDYTNQQKQTSNPQKITSNSFVFIVVGLIIVFVVVLVASSKMNEKGEYDNFSSESTETYVPQNYDNYQPSNTQQEYDNRTDELTSSTNLNGKFSIGSNKQEVLNIQGNPTRTMKLDALDEEIWNYGLSSVTFKNGKVNEYSDLSNNLKVQYSDNSTNDNLETERSYVGNFSIGSSKKEVLNIQGNPTGTMKLDALNEEIWNYGLSSVTFKNGKVSEYSDLNNNLKVQYSNNSTNDNVKRERNYSGNFSIGSSKKEVLNIQGNPTRTMKLDALNEEIWNYGSSSVTFKNGKVSEYSNLSNNLKIQY